MTDDGGVDEKTSGGVPAAGDEGAPAEDDLNFTRMKKKKKTQILALDALGEVEPIADDQKAGWCSLSASCNLLSEVVNS